MMKSEYKTPSISVEALEKTDILMSSAEVTPVDPSSPSQKLEKENRYMDFMSFVADPRNWFD